MAYWLIKSEPETWSWTQQVNKGEQGEPWTGVRNYQARNFMREMQIGDLVFFYHSVKERQIVGIVRVIKTAYADPTDETGKFDAVDVQVVETLKKPVTLDQIKNTPALQTILLIKQSRLSVMPVAETEWHTIMSLSQK